MKTHAIVLSTVTAIGALLAAGCAEPAASGENDEDVGALDEGVTDAKLLAMKSNIMDKTKLPIAHIANGMGYGWIGGCKVANLGDGYSKYLTGDMSDTEWVPQGESGCNEDNSAKSSQRTHIKYVNWRLKDLGVTYNPASMKTTYSKPVAVAQYTYRNYSGSASKDFTVGPYNHTVTKQVAVTLTNGWNFQLTAGYEFEASLFGFAKETFKFSVQAGTSGSVAKATTVIDTKSDSYAPVVTVPPHTKYVVTVTLSEIEKSVPIHGRAELQFDVYLAGFLRWSYNARDDFPRDRPTWNKNYGTFADLGDTLVNSLDGWSWDAQKTRGLSQLQFNFQPNTKWGISTLQYYLGGDSTSATRINVIPYGGTAVLPGDKYDYSVVSSSCSSPNC
jgi:hypothetical protein